MFFKKTKTKLKQTTATKKPSRSASNPGSGPGAPGRRALRRVSSLRLYTSAGTERRLRPTKWPLLVFASAPSPARDPYLLAKNRHGGGCPSALLFPSTSFSTIISIVFTVRILYFKDIFKRTVIKARAHTHSPFFRSGATPQGHCPEPHSRAAGRLPRAPGNPPD